MASFPHRERGRFGVGMFDCGQVGRLDPTKAHQNMKYEIYAVNGVSARVWGQPMYIARASTKSGFFLSKCGFTRNEAVELLVRSLIRDYGLPA